MRELKFRVWDGKCYRGNLKKYFLNLHDGEISEVAYSDLYDEYYDASERGSKLIIQQYTGLKDKNGKEICEGDIIHYKFDGASYPKEAQDKLLTCEYDASFGGYTFDCKGGSYYWAEIQGYVEIVGNIFENNELLKQ
jgi:uncharacterized phage protein (TIGR01671 family)